MKRISVIALFVLSLAAPAAFAQLQPKQPYTNDAWSYDIVSTCNSVDECFAAGITGGNYAACSAFGRSGQTCVQLVRDATSTTSPAFCAYVTKSAYCYCDTQSKTQGGACSYYK